MLRKRDILCTGFALFAMLFGAGNLIFPPRLGHSLGDQWGIAAIGFILTGVGFPLLGLIAAAHTGRHLNDFGRRFSLPFSKCYISILILTIGFFLAMPRTGATAYEMTLQNSGYSQPVYRYFFLATYFFITWLFSLKANKVISRIGSFLTPVLLFILGAIVYQGIMHPFAPVVDTMASGNGFSKGFLEGYQTMDTLAIIIYSTVIVKSMRQGKTLTKQEEKSFLWKSSLIAVTLLALVYGALCYIGAGFSGVQVAGNTALLSYIVEYLLGPYGKLALGIVVAGACLTTAIGLVATVGEYFKKILPWSYKSIVTLTCIAGFVFSNLGVDAIIHVAVPILEILYPLSMMLIFLNLTKKYIRSKRVYQTMVCLSFVIGLQQALV